jgi:hypothetical protein
MVWRSIAGGIVGLAIWYLLFFALGVGVGLLWPDYRDAARVMFQERTFHLFTTPMLIMNLVVFTVAGLTAGWVSTFVAKNRITALLLTVLLFTYAAFEHFILLWNQLPSWYNLIVPIVMAGFVWLGSRINTLHHACR